VKSSVRILAGPPAHAALSRGVNRMARLLRPTLGPLSRTVAITRLTGTTHGPEVLDSGAVIARRTIQLADPFENMGGMLVRHIAWQVFERVGDGTATAAVLAQSLMQAGVRYIVAGGNPVSVARGMERGLEVALPELRRQARTIDGPAEIARVVAAGLGPTRLDLAEMLGEVVDAVGPDGAILVEDAQGTRTVHEYIDGVRWNEGVVSSFLLRPNEATNARIMNPRILVTDHPLDRAEQLLPVLEACVGAGDRNLLIVAPEVRDSAVGLLVANRERGVLEGVIAVKAPSFGVQRTHILEDIAAMTGGRCLAQERHDRLADVGADDLGRARQAWATRFAFGILGGQGSKATIRQRIADAKAELSRVDNDPHTTRLIRERIGKLAGTAAIVRVGAPTQAEQEELKLQIEAAVRSARSALRDGVVPGGGAALLACVAALEALEIRGDEGFGVKALAHALAEPMRAIVANAGLQPAPIVERARCERQVYDVIRAGWVDPWTAGIVDPLPVAVAALETSVSAIATALTSDVLIHRANPPMAVEP
jgi:chaperonin GroEL